MSRPSSPATVATATLLGKIAGYCHNMRCEKIFDILSDIMNSKTIESLLGSHPEKYQ